MSTRFLSLKMKNSKLFGVELQGVVGRSDREHLQELADKCLANDKTDVVVDLSGLRSIGGGGAAILADFQKRLVAAGGEAVFAGANDVVQHFLGQRFEDLPLRYYVSAQDAEREYYNETYRAPEAAGAGSDADHEPAADADVPVADTASTGETEPDESGLESVSELINDVPGLGEVGAVSFYDEDDEAEDADAGLDGLLAEFTKSRQNRGRRKEHQYMSLTDAVAALGDWSEVERCSEFAKALGNLLFSHGLAEDVLLLVATGDTLVAGDRAWEFSSTGGLAAQLTAAARPTTLLDLQDSELDETELTFLETVEPDMMLPVVRQGELAAVVFLKRGAEEHDYSVGENFAFELLIKVLAGGAEAPVNTEPPRPSPATDVGEVLLQLALELPEADDGDHFWRVFLRCTQGVLGATELAYLAADRSRPQVIANPSSGANLLNFSTERLLLFLRTIERPVQVANMPQFFKDYRDDLRETGMNWLVPLAWDGRFLGTALLGMPDEESNPTAIDLIEALFRPTARLLARFAGNNDAADLGLELMRILIGLREKRCFGSDAVTEAIVQQVHLLAGEMGFAPDQERHLIYGCLLRDLGLIEQDDALMSSPQEMTPDQWQTYRQHPSVGVQILKHLDLPQVIIDVVECHHERFNGEGFPRGLQGRQIPLAARVVTVVENYVAMIAGAGSQEALAPDAAAQVLRDNLGKRYDPDIVNVFLQAVLTAADRPPSVPA